MTESETPAQLKEEFWRHAEQIPTMQHPWFQGLINGELTDQQILAGEQQHYLRGRLNGKIFGAILEAATRESDEEVLAIAEANYQEEMGGPKTHGDLMFQFLEAHGMTQEEAAATEPMPGTMAAISMLTDSVRNMSALEGLAMMTLPERQNADVSAAVYEALKDRYSDYAIATYKVHATVDVEHGDTQLDLLAHKVMADPSIKPQILRAIKFGLIAFKLEWDGHQQAATGNEYFHWAGV